MCKRSLPAHVQTEATVPSDHLDLAVVTRGKNNIGLNTVGLNTVGFLTQTVRFVS